MRKTDLASFNLLVESNLKGRGYLVTGQNQNAAETELQYPQIFCICKYYGSDLYRFRTQITFEYDSFFRKCNQLHLSMIPFSEM